MRFVRYFNSVAKSTDGKLESGKIVVQELKKRVQSDEGGALSVLLLGSPSLALVSSPVSDPLEPSFIAEKVID